MARASAALFFATLLATAPAAAQTLPAGPPLHPSAADAADLRAPSLPLVPGEGGAPGRPRRTLTTLYASYATLQMLDVHSTSRALAAGGHEANPLMAPITGTIPAFSAVKAAGTALTIHTIEKLRKRNPAAAVAVMVGLNSLYVAVVIHNYRVNDRR